ncbi:hypothetical protein [Azospirillum sp. SYSU D00513]|uniref:hypothetical protein n=1 Tax=Azospirillum sp. SYSU D00513 TaxID=2812561 RepID=UPI001A974278|nr:hypothetical protein [Azospirillum sp. SYSU D00513]
MAPTDVVRPQNDPDLKREAAERALPFEVRVPNETTQAALHAARRSEVARFDDVAGLMADLNDDEE